MLAWSWVWAAGIIASFFVKAAIKFDCLQMIEVPPQFSAATQKWLNCGIGLMAGLLLLPVGPVVKDFVSASAHAIERVHVLDQRNADDYCGSACKKDPVSGVIGV